MRVGGRLPGAVEWAIVDYVGKRDTKREVCY